MSFHFRWGKKWEQVWPLSLPPICRKPALRKKIHYPLMSRTFSPSPGIRSLPSPASLTSDQLAHPPNIISLFFFPFPWLWFGISLSLAWTIAIAPHEFPWSRISPLAHPLSTAARVISLKCTANHSGRKSAGSFPISHSIKPKLPFHSVSLSVSIWWARSLS